MCVPLPFLCACRATLSCWCRPACVRTRDHGSKPQYHFSSRAPQLAACGCWSALTKRRARLRARADHKRAPAAWLPSRSRGATRTPVRSPPKCNVHLKTKNIRCELMQVLTVCCIRKILGDEPHCWPPEPFQNPRFRPPNVAGQP